jgi:hypothetical protein
VAFTGQMNSRPTNGSSGSSSWSSGPSVGDDDDTALFVLFAVVLMALIMVVFVASHVSHRRCCFRNCDCFRNGSNSQIVGVQGAHAVSMRTVP